MKKIIITVLVTLIAVTVIPYCIEAYLTTEIEKRAEEGYEPAQFEMGVVYSRGKYQYKKNEEKAVYWFEKSGKKGNSRAYYKLGSMYLEEPFKQGPFKSDNKKAIKYLSKIPKYDDAALIIGMIYSYGFGNINKNSETGIKWLSYAVELKNEPSKLAAYMLGELYELGEINGTPDINNAIKWYEYAAKLGDNKAAEKVQELTKQQGY